MMIQVTSGNEVATQFAWVQMPRFYLHLCNGSGVNVSGSLRHRSWHRALAMSRDPDDWGQR